MPLTRMVNKCLYAKCLWTGVTALLSPALIVLIRITKRFAKLQMTQIITGVITRMLVSGIVATLTVTSPTVMYIHVPRLEAVIINREYLWRIIGSGVLKMVGAVIVTVIHVIHQQLMVMAGLSMLTL